MTHTSGPIPYQVQTKQQVQYYPSGLPWAATFFSGANLQPYKYGGKEFVEMHSLDEYDSEARWYYPALMCTTTMDPLCEKYYSISPYAWCGNNPVNIVDPDGREWENEAAERRGNNIIRNLMLRKYDIEQQYSLCQSALENGNLSEAERSKLEDKMNHLREEKNAASLGIAAMCAIALDKNNKYGFLENFAPENGNFVIYLNGVVEIVSNFEAMDCHEATHIFQSLSAGGMQFNSEGRLMYAGTSVEEWGDNEKQAYQVQFVYDPQSVPASIIPHNKITDITKGSIGNLKKADGRYAYPWLRK